jgi:hypothetical protein
VGDIDVERQSLRFGFTPNLCSHLIGCRLINVGNDDTRTGAPETKAIRFADTVGTSGDDNDFAF